VPGLTSDSGARRDPAAARSWSRVVDALQPLAGVMRHIAQRTTVLGAACLLLAGCAARPVGPQASGPWVVAIAVVHDEGSDGWHVSYSFPEPVRGLRFRDHEYLLRGSAWQIETPGVRIVREGAGEALVCAGAGVRAIALRIAGGTRRPEKASPLVLAFADGSRLIYTGYFDVVAEGRPAETRFTFTPRPRERVVLGGAVSDGPATWTAGGEGTFAYFGQTTPIITRDLVLVVDAGAPAWLLERTTALFPRLFALYAARTGQALGWKPVVLLGYGADAVAGSRSLGGSTLPGLVQLEVRLGSRFQGEPDAALVEDTVHLLAHEAAHFWNGQMFRNAGEGRGGDWLHEGAADAFALRALLELGVIGRERYLARLSQALSGCVLGLAEASLHESSQPGLTKNHYNCGSTIALLTEAALRAHDPRDDLFRFWGRVFAQSRDRRYDEVGYLARLGADGGGPGIAAAAAIAAALDARGGGAALVAQLGALGVRAVADDGAMTGEYRQLAGKLACRAVIRRDCGERALADESGPRCAIDRASHCRTLRPGAALTALGQQRIFADGVAAYDEVVAACGARGVITVDAAAVACTRLAARPAYLRIEELPW
jgi:hypothetical protein